MEKPLFFKGFGVWPSFAAGGPGPCGSLGLSEEALSGIALFSYIEKKFTAHAFFFSGFRII